MRYISLGFLIACAPHIPMEWHATSDSQSFATEGTDIQLVGPTELGDYALVQRNWYNLEQTTGDEGVGLILLRIAELNHDFPAYKYSLNARSGEIDASIPISHRELRDKTRIQQKMRALQENTHTVRQELHRMAAELAL